ncbi:MAG: signal recognition particle protein, partial [Gammaproteobacteria bacterium]|nr:signal recognition particle protein [Gammaproteobacteria bacterium]
VGLVVLKSLTPGQALIRVVHEELVRIMGEPAQGLDLRTQPPAVVMVAGLQGSGKTTTVAKLADWLQKREKKKVLVASADVYRPAAILQLEKLAESIGAGFMPSNVQDKPTDIARRAIAEGRRQLADVVLLDTAGRLHVDAEMMQEVSDVHAAAMPVETLFVLDSMAGQDAVNAARVFDEALPLTGIVLTKTDGDARGGAALSARKITGKPIKFIGTGEKVDAFDLFHPERVASRILGMGDVLSLVEQVQEKADKDKSEKLARKLKKGKGFNLEDLRDQLEQMLSMGGMSGLLDKLPGMGQVPDAVRHQTDDLQIRRQIALINSMTPGERRHPRIINGSRKRRIAAGSGQAVQDVNRLVKQHGQMQKVMKKMSKGGPKALLRAMKGRLPPGLS